jgi:hypothetical protein
VQGCTGYCQAPCRRAWTTRRPGHPQAVCLPDTAETAAASVWVPSSPRPQLRRAQARSRCPLPRPPWRHPRPAVLARRRRTASRQRWCWWDPAAWARAPWRSACLMRRTSSASRCPTPPERQGLGSRCAGGVQRRKGQPVAAICPRHRLRLPARTTLHAVARARPSLAQWLPSCPVFAAWRALLLHDQRAVRSRGRGGQIPRVRGGALRA